MTDTTIDKILLITLCVATFTVVGCLFYDLCSPTDPPPLTGLILGKRIEHYTTPVQHVTVGGVSTPIGRATTIDRYFLIIEDKAGKIYRHRVNCFTYFEAKTGEQFTAE
jgi:hypothetical protein